MSFPLRERGLKRGHYRGRELYPASFPLRERGLKLFHDPINQIDCTVVPRAGTWIETQQVLRVPNLPEVVPLAGTWIETIGLTLYSLLSHRRSPCGNVD